jgi:2-succinyl-6-hydroxy-2,4-cyclohexadiene-1-carboxylate synthase
LEGKLIHVRGVNYYVAVAGSGQPVLLLHGFTGSHKTWDDFTRNCQGEYQFVMPDLPGHGQTDCPFEVHRYSTEETIQDLTGLLDALHIEKCLCLGYSMGGRIALSFTLAHTERVRGLVLESASPGLASEAEKRLRIEHDNALAKRIETIGIRAFADEWAKIPLFASQHRLPQHVKLKQQQIRCGQHETGLSNSLRGIGTGSQPSNWSLLHNLHIPTLLVTGMLDKKFTEIAFEMMKRLPNALHEEVANAGHTVHLESPLQFARLAHTFFSNLSE